MAAKKRGETSRQNWLDVWDELAYFVMPSMVGFNSSHVPGERFKWSRRTDTTAGQANKTLANHLHMALCSPSSAWFEGEFDDPDINKLDAAKEWAQDTTERMFRAFNYSNFNGKINLYFQVLGAFGTSNLEANFISTAKEPFKLVFSTPHLNNTVYDVDVNGVIDTVFEDVTYTKRQAETKFNRKFEDGNSSNNTTYRSSVDQDVVTLIKITLPNEDFDPDSLSPKKREYIVHWVYNKEIFKTEYIYEMSYMVARFEEIYDDRFYGEGPGLLALSDIRSINTAKRLEFRGYEKGIDPPLMGAAGGVIGDLHIEAGGFTQVRDPRMVGELPGKMDINLVMIKGEELRDSIRRAFKIDELTVPEKSGNPRTATEIQVKYEQAQKAMGATVGRIESELLKPLVKRTFGMMFRNGQFADMPEEIAGAEFNFRYVGPLAKSQVSGDAVAIERILQAGMSVAQIDPQALMVIDTVKAMRMLADRYSTPAQVIRSEKEVEQIQQQQAQAQQQQAATEQQMGQAQADQASVEATSANVELMKQVQTG